MNKRFLFPAVIVSVIASMAFAEPSDVIVRGKVFEEGTGKPLEGMTVFVLKRRKEGVITDTEGKFALNVGGPGEYSIAAAGKGYARSTPLKITINAASTGVEDVVLFLEAVWPMKEVIVTAERNKDKTAKIEASGGELASVPGSMGDPLRGMQALPGITTSSDTNNEPVMRGSGPENNAYYVDFLPVGYLFHFGDASSVVNARLVHDFNIYTSSFGPEFADVTGGIVDVKLRNPRTDKIAGAFGIITGGADLLLEGPVSGDKSFSLAGRRTYADFFASRADMSDSNVTVLDVPRSYDYQGKFLWKISQNHTLALQTSGAGDRTKVTFSSDSDFVKHEPIFAGDFNYAQSYHTLGAVLTSEISPNVNNKLGVSFLETNAEQQLALFGHSNIDSRLVIIRDHASLATSATNEVLLGIDSETGTLNLDLDIPVATETIWNPATDFTSSGRYFNHRRYTVDDWGTFIKDRWKVFDQLTLSIGERTSYEKYFDKYLIEPRLSAEYSVTDTTLLTAGWGKYHQFPQIEMVLEGLGNPDLDFEKADHYTLGWERRLPDGWSVRIEEYYKRLYNLVIPHLPENFINGGSGQAYGTELFIKKDRTGPWWGWVSIGHSKTKRHNDITGEDFVYSYDQPNIINVVYNRVVAGKWLFSALWTYRSGAPFTPVVNTYTDGSGRIRPVYGALGSERLPDYHSLTLNIGVILWDKKQKVSFSVGLLNVYNRKNVSGYDYNADYTARKPIEEFPFTTGFGVQVEY